MTSLKEKILNKKLLIVIALIVLIIVVIKIVNVVAESVGNSEVLSKSGLSNIYAIASTSSIKGNETGVEEFLELAKEQNI